MTNFKRLWRIIALLSLSMGIAYAETIFVTLEKDNALALMDPVSGKLIKTISIGKRPRGMTMERRYLLQPVMKIQLNY
jgi:hypothetical protein